ncbi:Protein distal antenna-related [Nesidiocoris tenuis]|uniref:Protein distal antenna-related n=1 Tax=Nesidiocoris tenuis TaxID=355587 RepID=A0ABN7AH19_9HEMI|nr:Protein distal antenna-related [Nesidiocoris tenuis]
MASLYADTSALIADVANGGGKMNLKEMASLYSSVASKVSSNGGQKRPVRQLSVHEKLEAIQRVHEGESKASVARIIGVPESTLRGWCKNEDKLHAMATKTSPSPEPSPLLPYDGPSSEKRFKRDASDAAGAGAMEHHDDSSTLMLWLGAQRNLAAAAAAAAAAVSPPTPIVDPSKYAGAIDPTTAAKYTMDNASWFWRWYKHYGVEPSKEAAAAAEPLPLVKCKSSSSLDNVLLNLNNNLNHNNNNSMIMNGSLTATTTTTTTEDDAKENTAAASDGDEEDDPPETAAEALKHGERFLRWLECCSDPSVTAVQLLQFRYLLNNVKSCAERRANKLKPAALPRSKRK